MSLIIPKNYHLKLLPETTEIAIKMIKDTFETKLSKALNLRRVTAPLFVLTGTGINDDLNGVEHAVSFNVKALGQKAEVVHSLAKWKRTKLAAYDIVPGYGLYTDMNAIRADEDLDNLHSIYVDQWDWEKSITKGVAITISSNFSDSMYGINTEEPYKWSTGTLKNPWIWSACKSIVITRSTPAALSKSTTNFASMQFAGNADLVTPSLIVSSTISNGPVMIYMGQELGEKAADAEGFSGLDGRTTIFDYWSVPTLRRWYNEGKPGISKLTKQEKSLRKLYSTILNICNTESAISSGMFFDLMYVNYNNGKFNPHRQFAYLRGDEKATIVIAVNFDNIDVDVEINIPDLALKMLNIPEGEIEATELLTGEKAKKVLSSQTPFATKIPHNSAVMWKIAHHAEKCSKKKKVE